MKSEKLIVSEKSLGGSISSTRALGVGYSYGLGVGLVILGLILPAVAHHFHLPVRILLPMHWSALIAGLTLGPWGGLMVGLITPLSNWLLTGYPLIIKLVPMTGELMLYGWLTGLLTRRGLSPYWSLAIALILGRIGFLVLSAVNGSMIVHPWWRFAGITLSPGIFTAIVQVAALPSLTRRLTQLLGGAR
ncbi:MAG: hypothetical protein ACK4OO_00760 [bacterium]